MVAGHAAGFKVTLFSIEVGSRGMLDYAQFEALQSPFCVTSIDKGESPGVI